MSKNLSYEETDLDVMMEELYRPSTRPNRVRKRVQKRVERKEVDYNKTWHRGVITEVFIKTIKNKATNIISIRIDIEGSYDHIYYDVYKSKSIQSNKKLRNIIQCIYGYVPSGTNIDIKRLLIYKKIEMQLKPLQVGDRDNGICIIPEIEKIRGLKYKGGN